jgi:formamidopyrimidine-DNA glycosylase
VHPAVIAASLASDARHRLFAAVKHVLRTAIDRGAGAEDFTDRLPKGFLLPQRHAGGHCPRCGTKLTIDKRGGRTSFHCPKCQPEPRG